MIRSQENLLEQNPLATDYWTHFIHVKYLYIIVKFVIKRSSYLNMLESDRFCIKNAGHRDYYIIFCTDKTQLHVDITFSNKNLQLLYSLKDKWLLYLYKVCLNRQCFKMIFFLFHSFSFFLKLLSYIFSFQKETRTG